MKAALLIMAAGLGSRFGGGIKQLAPIDDGGHIIMDYSIHDAIEAGFEKIVFIIRRDIEEDFRSIIGERMEKLCAEHGVEVGYAFQSMEDLPEDYAVPEGRKKPWGTGQAVLSAKGLVREPFAVINADDFYGKQAFRSLRSFLNTEAAGSAFCMAGFILENTLSENGGVTRGVCRVDEAGYLTDVVETSDIVRKEGGVFAGDKALSPQSIVSMNMWGLTPAFFKTLELGFGEFLSAAVKENPLKAEYLLPIIIGKLLSEQKVSVKVLETGDKWFGVTYQEDRETVVQSVRKLISDGVYREDLYSDL